METVVKNIMGALKMIHSKRLSPGNSKLPKHVGIFNLLAREDCLNCSTCGSTCYAVFRQGAPNVYRSRKQNSILARNHTDALEHMIIQQMSKGKFSILRLHESGDFVTPEYIAMWSRIAKKLQHSGTKLFAFTKTYDIFREALEELDGCENVNIINSFIEGLRNYGTEDYCDYLVKEHGAYKCPDKHDGVCMTSCTYCLEGKKPCFVIHGSLKSRDKYEGEFNGTIRTNTTDNTSVVSVG